MKKLRTATLGLALVAAATAFAAPSARLHYPRAQRGPTVDHYFGASVPAPYQWMENLNSPAVQQWVAAENKLTFAYLAKIPLRGWINTRLGELWNYAKQRTPVQTAGGKLFFSRNAGLQNQSVVYVQDSPSAAPRELLDPNTLSPGGAIALLDYQPSPHGKYLVYALSQGGSDWQTLHLRDVATGKDLADVVQWVKFSGTAWSNDDQGFFYSRYPAPPKGRAISQQVVNQKLYYHTLGTAQSADKLIYARPDLPRWIIGGGVSEDGRYLFVVLVNGTAPRNELFYADLGDPRRPDVTAPLKPLFTHNDAQYTPFGVDGKTLFVLTTLKAPKGRIVAVKLDHPDPAHWREVVPQGKGVMRSAQLAGGRLLVNYQVVAKSRLSLFTSHGKPLGSIAFPTLGAVAGISARNDSQRIYYGFTSFLYPTSVYSYDVASGNTALFFKPEVAFDPAQYATKQVFYPSKDGTQVPMFIVARKGLKRDGHNPTILYAYGGFDITITPRFNPMLPVWLELGGVYAVANLRGGGAYGETWHEAGMLGNKQNVFNDFAWAARYLVQQKYTSTQKLGIQGYSNGGLLVGASITQRPQRFGAAYAGAGVMDMLRYQKFSGGSLWAPEYGSADDAKAFGWLYAYSPLQNIHQGTCYPPTMVTTADHDDRVVPSHSYQFVATLQHAQGCANPVLIRIATQTSHGYMPTHKRIAQTADVWAFEAYNLGIVHAPGAAGHR